MTTTDQPIHRKIPHEDALLCGAPTREVDRPAAWTSIPRMVRCPACLAKMIEGLLALAQQIHNRGAAGTLDVADVVSVAEAQDLAFGVEMLVDRLREATEGRSHQADPPAPPAKPRRACTCKAGIVLDATSGTIKTCPACRLFEEDSDAIAAVESVVGMLDEEYTRRGGTVADALDRLEPT